MRRSLGSIARVASRRRPHCLSSWAQISSPQECSSRFHRAPTHNVAGRRPIPSRSFWSSISAVSSDTSVAGNSHNHAESKMELQMPARKNEIRRDCSLEIAQLLGVTNGAILERSTWIKADSCVQDALQKGDFNLAFELLERMAQDPHAPAHMSSDTIDEVVDQWLGAYGRYRRTGEVTRYVYSPLSVWQRIESYLQKGIHMESRTLHRILEATALIKSKKLTGPIMAETILDTMLSLSRHDNPLIRPSFYTFNAVIAAWEAAVTNSPESEQLKIDAPERALKLLERLKALHAAGWGDDLMPDKTTYRRVMNLFAHTGDGDRVEALLEELYEVYLEHGDKSLLPSTPHFSLVLYAWSKSKDPTAAERAAVILNRMLEMERNKELPGFRVTAFCFNVVMVCWSRQRTKESAKKVQKLFDQMVALSIGDPSKKPIPGSYAVLITTWSHQAPKRAEEVFWAWKREHNLGNCDMRMDAKLLSCLIAGWFHSKVPDCAKRCDKLLQSALDGNLGKGWNPTVAAFNMTITAYCRGRKPADTDRAEAILEQMKSLAKSEPKFPGPSAHSYAPVIHALTRQGKVDKAELLLREWYDSVDLGNVNGMDDIDEDDFGFDSSKAKKQLRTKTLDRVLKAWLGKVATFPEAADRAENLLLKMSEWGVKPNLASFRFVLECRKRVRNMHGGFGENSDVVARANRILAFLDREYQAGHLKGDKSSYLATRREWALATV